MREPNLRYALSQLPKIEAEVARVTGVSVRKAFIAAVKRQLGKGSGKLEAGFRSRKTPSGVVVGNVVVYSRIHNAGGEQPIKAHDRRGSPVRAHKRRVKKAEIVSSRLAAPYVRRAEKLFLAMFERALQHP